jgi:predicted HicB family RNase H-like nuclease
MSRLTLRLPDSLHRQLEELASNEAVSLNQYIVYALTRQITLAYTVQAVPEKAVAEQRATYTALLQNLGEASFEQIQEALAERENIPPEDGLSPEIVKRIKQRVKDNT